MSLWFIGALYHLYFCLIFYEVFIFGLSKDVKNVIVKSFLLKAKDVNPRIISVLPYITVFLISIPMYLYFFGEALNHDRYIGDFNRNVFANFFILYMLKCFPVIVLTYALIQSIEVKKYVLQKGK